LYNHTSVGSGKDLWVANYIAFHNIFLGESAHQTPKNNAYRFRFRIWWFFWLNDYQESVKAPIPENWNLQGMKWYESWGLSSHFSWDNVKG
jgi:hypothetical protein